MLDADTPPSLSHTGISRVCALEWAPLDPDTFTVKDISLMVGLLCDDFPAALFDAAVAVLGLESTDAPVEGGKGLQAVLTLFMYTGTCVAHGHTLRRLPVTHTTLSQSSFRHSRTSAPTQSCWQRLHQLQRHGRCPRMGRVCAGPRPLARLRSSEQL